MFRGRGKSFYLQCGLKFLQTSIFNPFFTTPNIDYFICKHAGFKHIVQGMQHGHGIERFSWS